MTLMEMLAQGSALHLIGMGIIFIVMVLLLSLLGKGVAAKYAAEKDKPVSAPITVKAGNDAVIAAITAAVNEYKKTNK